MIEFSPRLRGDWSDTGPNARPEAEGRGESAAEGDGGVGGGGGEEAEGEAAAAGGEGGEGEQQQEQQQRQQQPAGQDLQESHEMLACGKADRFKRGTLLGAQMA